MKLSRGANETDTGKVQKWLSKTAKNYELGEVKVALRDAHHEEVHSWTLKNAIPVKWGITTFDAGGGSVAIETLELIHNGFLDDELNPVRSLSHAF